MAVANYKIKGAHCGLSGQVSQYTEAKLYAMIDRRNNKIEMPKAWYAEAQTRTTSTEQRRRLVEDLEKFDFSIPTGRKELKDLIVGVIPK